MTLIHRTELGRLGVSVLSPRWPYGEMYLRYTIWQNRVKPQHICPHVSLLLPFTSSTRAHAQRSVHPSVRQPPIPRCCRWVCFVDPTPPHRGCLRRQPRWVMRRGRRGVWQSSAPPPPEGRRWRLNETRSEAAGVDTSYQLSGVSWVSMSTLQMGHFLLVANHWSTHAWWKRCMQGNLLQIPTQESLTPLSELGREALPRRSSRFLENICCGYCLRPL